MKCEIRVLFCSAVETVVEAGADGMFRKLKTNLCGRRAEYTIHKKIETKKGNLLVTVL